jgi:hypothetical protein
MTEARPASRRDTRRQIVARRAKMKYVSARVAHMIPRALCLAAALCLCASTAAAQATDVIGRIKSASGEVFLVRHKTAIPVKAGQTLLVADGIRTGADGHVGITLQDETRLSLGPNSDVRLEQFVYAPGEGRLRFALRIARGLIAYVSGRIAKLSPESVRLETPSAILGVRGTRLAIRVEAQGVEQALHAVPDDSTRREIAPE